MLFDRVFISLISSTIESITSQAACTKENFHGANRKFEKTLCINFYISNFDEYTKLFI